MGGKATVCFDAELDVLMVNQECSTKIPQACNINMGREKEGKFNTLKDQLTLMHKDS